jgi:hypothetical protein
MKKIILHAIVIAAIFCNSSCKTTKQTGSQTSNNTVTPNIVLNNGQKITVTSTTDSDTDLGMGQATTSTSSTNIITVIATDDNNYRVTNTLTKLKMSTDAMGQSTKYDSEKPEDKDNEMGKIMSSKINVTDTSLVNKMTGVIVKQNNSPEKEEKDDAENPLGGLTDALGMSSGKDLVLESAFFIIPRDKKIADSWTDSSSQGKMKTSRTYTLKSVNNDIATITVNATVTGSGESEMQGTSVAFTINTKSTGEMIVDMKKGLVNNITNKADVNMTMDVMGQSLPISGKTNSTITYQY